VDPDEMERRSRARALQSKLRSQRLERINSDLVLLLDASSAPSTAANTDGQPQLN